MYATSQYDERPRSLLEISTLPSSACPAFLTMEVKVAASLPLKPPPLTLLVASYGAAARASPRRFPRCVTRRAHSSAPASPASPSPPLLLLALLPLAGRHLSLAAPPRPRGTARNQAAAPPAPAQLATSPLPLLLLHQRPHHYQHRFGARIQPPIALHRRPTTTKKHRESISTARKAQGNDRLGPCAPSSSSATLPTPSQPQSTHIADPLLR